MGVNTNPTKLNYGAITSLVASCPMWTEKTSMAMYSITARRINDRPDPGGWFSSGTDLPTFSIDAASAENAADIAHSIAGHGAAGITRTIVQTYRETEDGGEE